MSAIVQLMTNDDYHAHEALGSTNLKDILKNPYSFANGIRKEQTPAMIMGSAIHCMIFEPHLFNQDYVVAPQYDGRTKEGKAIKEEFEAQSIGKTVLRAEEYETAKSCADSILHSKANIFFQNGIAEKAFFSEIDGISVKCKPDYYIESMGLVVDVKKCADASPDGFQKAAANFGYYLSASLYLDVLQSLGHRADKFLFVCVEDKAPFMVAVYEYDPMSLEFGRNEYKRALDIFKRIDQYSEPIYKDTMDSTQIIQTITVPSYVTYKNNASY